MSSGFVFRLTAVRESHPAFPGLTGPLPRPDHPLKVPCGWSGRPSENVPRTLFVNL